MNVAIDYARAELVIGQLLAAFTKGEYPYTEAWALPQNFIPKEITDDPLLHARFLFFVCHYMRGGIKSDMAVKRLVALWRAQPDYFDPYVISAHTDIPSFAAVLGSYVGYKVKEISRFWIENAARLKEQWEGDPRTLFNGVTTAEELYRRVANWTDGRERVGFLGFQEKMSSMLFYFLHDAQLISELTVPPPVDFHLLRVMLATGILVPQKNGDARLRYEHASPAGRDVLEWYARTHTVQPVVLGNALWMLSVVLCSATPGNVSVGRRKEKNGPKTHPVRQIPSWANKTHVGAYAASCGRCPVQSLCSLNIPSGDFYERGELILYSREQPDLRESSPLFDGGLRLHSARRPRQIHLQAPHFTPKEGSIDTTSSPLPLFPDLVTGQVKRE